MKQNENLKLSKTEIINRLNEFNKGANELFEQPFIQKMRNSGLKITAKKGEPAKIEVFGPNDFEIKAFCNDIRKFIQPRTDLLRLARLYPVYQSEIVEPAERKLFNDIINEFENFKKQTTNHTINGENLTNERVLNVFLYGKVVHRSEGESTLVHDFWETIPIMYHSLKNEFVSILYAYFTFVNNLVFVNKNVLEKLNN
jgi:hypothetical protein